MRSSKQILFTIIFAQFCCTSLWFASNGIINDLIKNFNLSLTAFGHLTAAVQFGFIIGTLVFAILNIADRFPPSIVFFFSALMAASFNLGILWQYNSIESLLAFRFLTGFFLAGIYPVGMKIATDYYEKGLGKSLGLIVGALVLGTAFPYLLKGIGSSFIWEYVIISTSSLSFIGGLLMLILVPAGPFRKKNPKIDLTACFKIFKNREFKVSAFGYFGHMWELYAFWAFVPFIISTYNELNPTHELSVFKWSFFIIAIGGVSSIISGFISSKFGIKKAAYTFLIISGLCCLFSPIILQTNSSFIFLLFMLIWGSSVIADSPLFSTLVAQNAPNEIKGTALTIVNCIGYSITILSIQILTYSIQIWDSNLIFMILAIGPLFSLFTKFKKNVV